MQGIELYSVVVQHHCNLFRHVILTYCIIRMKIRYFSSRQSRIILNLNTKKTHTFLSGIMGVRIYLEVKGY
jgi:hypothetical protein